MEKPQNNAAPQGAGAPGGARQRNPPIDVDYYDAAWHVIDRVALTVPTFKITIQARQEVVIEIGGDVAAVGCDGITLMSGDRRLDVDHRYNAAVESYRGDVAAVSNTVRYRGAVYEAKEFVELFKRRVKELIMEAAATVGV